MRYVLIGAGGQASEVMMSAAYDISGCVVDAEYGNAGDVINGMLILGDLEWLRKQDGVRALCAIGYPKQRYDLVARAGDIEWFSRLKLGCCVDKTAKVGIGCLVASGAIVMNDVQIGNHVLLNIASSVSHGSKLGDFCTLSPGARVAGNCTLGEGVFLGMNSSVIENVTIGDWAKVGAGTVVLEDVPAGTTVVGVPGRVVKRD